MKCGECEHCVEFNGKIVCDVPTLKHGDCPELTEPELECSRKEDFEAKQDANVGEGEK